MRPQGVYGKDVFGRDKTGYMAGQKRKRTETTRRSRVQTKTAPRKSFKSFTRYSRAKRNMVPSGYLAIERKFFDTSKTATAVAASTDMSSAEYDPTGSCLNYPVQGSGASTREGDFYYIDSVEVSGWCGASAQVDQTGADQAPVVKAYLVLDKFTNAAQLNSEDVFVNPSGSNTLCANPFRNIKNESRFDILDSVYLQMTPPTLSYDGTNIEQSGQTHSFVLRKRFSPPLKVSCVANGGSVADIRDNSLHVIATANNTNFAPVMAYNARIRFRG